MKLVINSKEILKAVQSVGSLIKTPSPLPILETILFHFEDSVLRLEADNLEIRSSLELKVDFFGSYFTCMPYSLLVTMLKSFPDAPVEFEFSDQQVTLTVGTGVYHLPVQKANEFPKNKYEAAGDKTQFNSMDFVESLKKAVSFSGTDTSLWDSTVMIWIGEDATRLVGGTNNAVFEETLDVKGKDTKLIISRSTASYLVNSIYTEEVLEICYTENRIFFLLEDRQISAILSNAKWPDYKRIFDNMVNDKKFRIEKNVLMPCLKRLSTITEKDKNIIKLNFNQDQLELTFNHIEKVYNAKETIKCDFTGDNIETGFPADQLLTTLTYTDDDTVMEFSDSTKPCLVTQGKIRCLIAAVKPAS